MGQGPALSGCPRNSYLRRECHDGPDSRDYPFRYRRIADKRVRYLGMECLDGTGYHEYGRTDHRNFAGRRNAGNDTV